MKRLYIFTTILLMTICGMTAMAQDRPDITHQTGGGDRDKTPGVFFAQPTLEYDQETNLITVYGFDTFYYDVVITMQSTGMIVWQGMIDGVCGIIDASILINGTYVIKLIDDGGRYYTWTFDSSMCGTRLPNAIDRMSDRFNRQVLGGNMTGLDTLF